ncbi:MAG: hypothetical protein ABSH34_18835 [Verrucomicrobiota bacterium]|jgi:hypothetical protein
MSSDINFSSGASFIHYDPERVDYSISESELEQLRQCADNLWKDFCLACSGVGIPCLINAMSLAKKATPFVPTLEFNLNLVVGILGITLGIAFGIVWFKTKRSSKGIIDLIKAKPEIKIK